MIINSGSYVAGGGVTLKQAGVVAETGLSQNTIQSDILIGATNCIGLCFGVTGDLLPTSSKYQYISFAIGEEAVKLESSKNWGGRVGPNSKIYSNPLITLNSQTGTVTCDDTSYFYGVYYIYAW